MPASCATARRETLRKARGKLFGFSILYLFLLFAVLLAEHRRSASSALGCTRGSCGVSDSRNAKTVSS